MTAFGRVKPEGVTANASQRHWEDSSCGGRNNSSLQTGWQDDCMTARWGDASVLHSHDGRRHAAVHIQLNNFNPKNYFPQFTCLYHCRNHVPFQEFNANSKQHFKPSRTITPFQQLSSKAQQKEGLINVYKFTAMFRQGFTCCEKRRLALKAAIIQGVLTRWAFCWLTRHVWQLNSQQQFNLNRRRSSNKKHKWAPDQQTIWRKKQISPSVINKLSDVT